MTFNGAIAGIQENRNTSRHSGDGKKKSRNCGFDEKRERVSTIALPLLGGVRAAARRPGHLPSRDPPRPSRRESGSCPSAVSLRFSRCSASPPGAMRLEFGSCILLAFDCLSKDSISPRRESIPYQLKPPIKQDRSVSAQRIP
ncbi:hypothetical protein [Burkholderia gladioli]|uniref:hypothetical protein n=1 Tax=Burkholderia gladioli TaxID=28095 RepID=UPI00163EC044|nr:hypothetical protein [Burkholderia gladioli]